MRDGWREEKLGEMVLVERTRMDPRDHPDELLTHFSIPAFDDSKTPIVEPGSAIGSQKFEVRNEAVLLSLLNPRISRVWKVSGSPAAICSTEFAVLVPKPELVDIDFLFALLGSSTFQEKLRQVETGSTNSRKRVPPASLGALPLLWPPLSEQRRIADLVVHFDEVIARVQEAEVPLAQARTSLILDLLSETRAQKQGWREGKLGEYAETSKDRWDPKVSSDIQTYVALEHLTPGSRQILQWADSDSVESQKTRFTRGEVLFGKLRPYLRKVSQASFDGVCSTDILVFRSRDFAALDPTYLFYLLSSEKTIEYSVANSAGTRMPRISEKRLSEMPVVLPPLAEQERIASVISEVDTAIDAQRTQREELEKLRNGLLSVLLSGEHEIPESYDRFLEEAA